MAKQQEITDVMKIYKIVGIIAVILLIIGIIYAFTRSAEEPKIPEKIEQEIIENITIEQNATIEDIKIENITIEQNITTEQNTTNVTVEQNTTTEQNATIPTENKTTSGVIKYTWETVKIEFPDTLKRLSAGATTHHYITITEADGTPITNGEQFNLQFWLDQAYGSDSEVVSSFEGGKWLITLRLSNKGTYGIIVKITCEDQGYCYRFYPKGNIEKTQIFEVV